MHSRGETAHEAKMADTFCAGCESNIGQGSLGFPICKEKVTTCTMVPINAILQTEIKIDPRCLKNKES